MSDIQSFDLDPVLEVANLITSLQEDVFGCAQDSQRYYLLAMAARQLVRVKDYLLYGPDKYRENVPETDYTLWGHLDNLYRQAGDFDLEFHFDNVLPQLYWVAAYSTWREFGGQEEGGWYYSAGRLITDPNFYKQIGMLPAAYLTEEDAWRACNLMRAKIQTQIAPLPGYYDVRVCRGEVESHFPKERPYYS